MDVINLPRTLITIRNISMILYLQRLNNCINPNYNSHINDKTNSFEIINSFVTYLNDHEADKFSTNSLTYCLMNNNVLYDKNSVNINYNQKFKKILFDHIIHSVIFNEYGNIYGFLAYHVLISNNDYSLDVFLENVKLSLTSMKIRTIKLDELVIERIFQKTIVPLFPQLRNNLSLYSMDLIYSHAGCRYLYSYTNTNSKKTKHIQNDYFDKCLEMGLEIQQLATNGIIKKLWLKTFALPAILHYVYVNKKYIHNVNMIKEIISKPNHWSTAYEFLFSYLNNSEELLKKAKETDPKYQYYLAVLNFKNDTTLAEQELMDKCEFSNETQLNNEIDNYINNSTNYICSSSKNLVPLERIRKEQLSNILHKYFQFKMVTDEEINNNLMFDRYEISGKTFVDCKKELNSKTEINFYNQHNILNHNENTYCLSLLYSCIVGFIERNDSPNNCPIKLSNKKQIQILMQFDQIYQQFTTNRTRILLSQYGTTLKTISLISSIQKLLNNEKLYLTLKKINLTNNETFGKLGLPILSGIDCGLEIQSIHNKRDKYIMNRFKYTIKRNWQ